MLEVIGPLVVVVLAVAGIAILAWRWNSQRKQSAANLAALQWLAQQRNWTYKRSDAGSADRFAGNFPFPLKSFNASSKHLITGMHRGRPFSAFEYTTHAGPVGMRRRSDITHKRWTPYWIIAVALPAHRPQLAVEGRNSAANADVGARIQTGHEQFDSAFIVSTDHDQFARDVLHPQLLQWLLAHPIAHQIAFRFERNELVAWQPGKLDARKLEPVLNMLCDSLDQVPAAVWR